MAASVRRTAAGVVPVRPQAHRSVPTAERRVAMVSGGAMWGPSWHRTSGSSQRQGGGREPRGARRVSWGAGAKVREPPPGNHPAIECCNKTKTMRKEYRQVVTHNARSGAGASTCPYYKELDGILHGDATWRCAWQAA